MNHSNEEEDEGGVRRDTKKRGCFQVDFQVSGCDGFAKTQNRTRKNKQKKLGETREATDTKLVLINAVPGLHLAVRYRDG